MLSKIWRSENFNEPKLDYKDLIKDKYYIDLSEDSYRVNEHLNDEYGTSFYIGINSYLSYATDNHKDKIDMKTMKIMTNDLKTHFKTGWYENINNDIYSLRSNKRKELIFYNLIKFIVKTIMIGHLLNSHGQLVIFDYLKYSEFREYDDFNEVFVHPNAIHFFSVFPKSMKTKDKDIYSVNGEFNLESSKKYETVNLGYDKRMCNITINYERLDCDKHCEDILKGFQDKPNYTICYYDVSYNIFTNILIYTLILLLAEIYLIFKCKNLYNDYFKKLYLLAELKDNTSILYQTNNKYFKDYEELIKIKERKYNIKYIKFKIRIIVFLTTLFINFLWSDITNYTLGNYEDNEYIYNNFMLLGEGFNVNDLDYLNLKVKYYGYSILIWITGCMNRNWYTLPFLFIPYFGAKIVFSLINLFRVFEVGFLRPNLFPIAFNLFNPITFFKPLFWYYFELFIYPFILDMLIFKSHLDLINFIKNLKKSNPKKNNKNEINHGDIITIPIEKV